MKWVFFIFWNEFLSSCKSNRVSKKIYTFTIMKKIISLTKYVPVVVLLCALMAAASCTSNKKYGCPNHLSAGFNLR